MHDVSGDHDPGEGANGALQHSPPRSGGDARRGRGGPLDGVARRESAPLRRRFAPPRPPVLPAEGTGQESLDLPRHRGFRLRGRCRRRRRRGPRAARAREPSDPPVSAWRRCHPPQMGGKRTPHPRASQRGIRLRVDAYPLIFSVLSTEFRVHSNANRSDQTSRAFGTNVTVIGPTSRVTSVPPRCRPVSTKTPSRSS
jgi:hypothetical protein